MVGAWAHTSPWDDAAGAGHAPTLASAPDGLSARRVERWLDLPPGAWQRRRLYALRIRSASFAYLGLRNEDLVIVEPGGREQPGSIVVTRGSAGSSLRRIAQPSLVERRMPTVLELPLRERTPNTNERVVGTVIGALRSTGTGALKPIPLGSPKQVRRTKASTTTVVALPSRRRESGPVSFDYLSEIQAKWRGWISRARETSAVPTPGQVERWDRLEASLSTLCDCLQRTHSPGLRDALSAEASAVVSAIRHEMGG